MKSLSQSRRWMGFLVPAFALLLVAASGAAHAQRDASTLLQAVVGVEADVPDQARTSAGLGTHREGSGVVITNDGLILTIGYLILEAVSVDIVMQDGKRISAEVVAYDHESGFGLVRAAQPLGVKPIELGDSGALDVSRQAIVASRDGLSSAVGVRVVSRRTFAGSWEYMIDDAIFTSPPHRQFGGAALIAPDGSLVGIGSLFVGDASGPSRRQPGNMFVPINVLKPILADLVEHGRRTEPAQPWLGVYPETVRGFVILNRLAEDSPAQDVGLRVGDLVVAVDGIGVSDLEDFYRSVWAVGHAGETVTVTILRQGGVMRDFAVPSIDRRDWLRLNPSY